jgi:hypothetical protein
MIEEYGTAVIALFVGGLIFAAVFGLADGNRAGLTVSAAGLITAQTKDCLNGDVGNQSFDEYRGRGKIQVEYANTPVVTGVMTQVSSLFTVASKAWGNVNIGLRAVYDSSNVRFHTQIQEGKEYLYLEHPGVYRVYYEAVDAVGRRQYGMLQIPVQRQ